MKTYKIPRWLTIEFKFDVKESQEILLSSHPSRSCTEKHFQSCFDQNKDKTKWWAQFYVEQFT